MIVVSEIGEQWSPQTAPAMQADTHTTPNGSVSGNTPSVIGIKIPKVPHDVPVANDNKHAITNIIAGKKYWKPAAEFLTLLRASRSLPLSSMRKLILKSPAPSI